MKTMGFKTETLPTTKTLKNTLMPCDFQHGICIGITGSGKTASLILPIMKDRLEKNHGILAYTYKGHEHRKIKYLAKEANRLNDVIELGKPHGKYINLMASLELNSIKEILERLIAGKNTSSDSYWTLSASRLGINIIDILRKLHALDTILKKELINTTHVRTVQLGETEDNNKIQVDYCYPSEDPSFKTLADIIKSPKSLSRFYKGLDKLLKNIRNSITAQKNNYTSDRMQEHNTAVETSDSLFAYFDDKLSDESNFNKSITQKVAIALLRLEKTIAPYKDFTIDPNSNEGTGNNGVLQVLNNAVLNLATKDYINTNDLNLLDELNRGAIAIVDIEGIENEIHGVLLESILKKLSLRIRNNNILPVSIFIDEANRVLLSEVDIHNDTLRESNVELLLAVQNEEQMIEKFGLIKWESIRKNFKHNYWINQSHYITYNEGNSYLSKPINIDDASLNNAEYAFNNIPHNRKIFEDKFAFDGELPKKFLVSYDIVNFEKNMSMQLNDGGLNIKEVEYLGEDFKHKLEIEMMEYGYFPEIKINMIKGLK